MNAAEVRKYCASQENLQVDSTLTQLEVKIEITSHECIEFDLS